MLNAPEIELAIDGKDISPDEVRAAVRGIVTSRHFRGSKRSQQFLEYVIEQKLSGNDHLIKERIIGIEVFRRNVNYATGEDPVVRVQASDVRRRLEAYRADLESVADISVELPTGTYVPVFRRKFAEELQAPSPTCVDPPSEGSLAALALGESSEKYLAADSHLLENVVPTPTNTPGRAAPSSRMIRWVIWSALMVIVGGGIGYLLHQPTREPMAIREFWGPVLSAQRPIVLNLGKPAVYVLSGRLYDQYNADNPGTFDRVDDRHNKFLPPDSTAALELKDVVPVRNSGPAQGGVRAGMILTSFFGRIGKPFSVRFGDEGSFVDLRDSPAVIVGNLNNRWTTDLENDFPFRIRATSTGTFIEEASTGRTWHSESSERGVKDFGLITREPSGITGTFLLKVAGLEDGGTEAACELVADSELLQAVIKELPVGWEKKNLQILVTTTIIARKPSPPQVIATKAW